MTQPRYTRPHVDNSYPDYVKPPRFDEVYSELTLRGLDGDLLREYSF
ncbi:MAG: hypothetical protein ACOCVG_02670 [Verrucomicrobiota bacterium]